MKVPHAPFWLFIATGALATMGCAGPSYERLEAREQTDTAGSVANRVADPLKLSLGVGWSATFRAIDSSDDPMNFTLRSEDESIVQIARVANSATAQSDEAAAEAGQQLVFLGRRAGSTTVQVVVGGAVEQRIPVSVNPTR